MVMDFTWAEMGDRIKALRIARGLTQPALAASANITQAGLFRIEAGETNPQLTTLQSIARVLKVPVRELVCGPSSENEGGYSEFIHRIRRVLTSADGPAIQLLANALNASEVIISRNRTVSESRKRHLERITGWSIPDEALAVQTKHQVLTRSTYREVPPPPKTSGKSAQKPGKPF
jgi:transcriptional regulator with XRE-family HTH domain